MEKAIETIVDTFIKYANDDGKLNKEEMGKLMEQEFPNPEVKAKLASGKLERMLERADKNRDEALCFREFIKVVSCIAKCHYHKKTGKAEED